MDAISKLAKNSRTAMGMLCVLSYVQIFTAERAWLAHNMCTSRMEDSR